MKTVIFTAVKFFCILHGRVCVMKRGGGGGGGSALYEIYIGFCPRIDFHNIMHIDFLTYDYSVCDIIFLLPIYMVKQ